jgi:hypothetical protein
MKSSNLQELHHLVGGLLDGDISDADFERLQFLLRDDPDCRVAYHEYCQLHAELQLCGNRHGAVKSELAGTDFVTACQTVHEKSRATDSEVAPTTAVDLAKRSTTLWSQWIKAPRVSAFSALVFGLSACLLGIIVGQIVRTPNDDLVPIARNPWMKVPGLPPLRTVATFAGGINATFRHDLAIGSRIGPGRLQLEQGIAEIVFDRGAVLVLNGPAELDLIDESTCYVLNGAVSAKVGPDANGFVLRTDALQVSEFDAEFGLRTTPDSTTELHVFDGKVRLVDFRDASHPVRLVTGGNAFRFGKGMPIDPFAADPTAFVSSAELARQRQWGERLAHERWQRYSHRWSSDRDTILRYDFRPTDDGSIINVHAPRKLLAESRQSVPRWVEGRWPNKLAMLFDGRTDMLSVPDHADLRLEGSFSVAVWIKARGNPPCWNRIVGKGTGDDRNYGLWMSSERALLWQICPDEDPQSQSVWDRSGVFSNPIPLDRWVLAVGVMDGPTLKIYVDGALHAARLRSVGDGFAKSDAPLTIGYYDNVPNHDAYFSGEIDEVLLLRRALSAEEIREMYELGCPELQIAPVGGNADSAIPHNLSI